LAKALAVNEVEFIAVYPRLWHMAEDGSWPSIQQNGLLSTAALLDLYRIDGARRFELLSRNRRESVKITRAGLPDAVVRDQKPMSDSALQKCLQAGMTPRQWYEMLNEKVFFWLSRKRLRRLLNARAYRNQAHTVLTVRTETLLDAHRDRILLSPINSGSTIWNPQPRGPSTFLPMSEYPFDVMRKRKGSRANAVVELTVSGGVRDIADHVLAAHRVFQGVSTELWRSPFADADDGP
jgi:hypothetical protein